MPITQELLAKVPYHRGNTVNPKFIFVGIAAGDDEFVDPQKRAFVGYSGQLLDSKLIGHVGISQNDCYFTNVIKERIPGHKHDRWIKDNSNAYDTYVKLLQAELELVSGNCNVLVPLGDIALRAICGKKGITNWRGSIIPSKLIPGKKCVPTIHPAGILREYSALTYTREDFKRIAEEGKTSTINLPKRTYIIRPSFDTAVTYLNKYFNTDKLVSVDIETLKSRPNRIVSIQFSDSPDLGFCLPLQYKNGTSYWTAKQEVVLWRMVYRILTQKRLIGQNFIRFDAFMLHFNGIPYKAILNSVYLDTLEAFACMQPELPHSLQFLTSIYTREPFYKEEGKAWGTREGEDEFWNYGCKDVCVVSEIAPQLEKELKEEGLWDDYIKFYRSMEEPRLRLAIQGLGIDLKKREELDTEYTKEIVKNQCELTVLAGSNINVNSPKQMQDLLYGTMKLPRQYKDDKVTTDEDALLTLSTRSESKIFPLIIAQRSARKLKSNNIDCKLDSDNRFRTSFGFTETGRFTSSSTALQTGGNAQNWPKKMRAMVIPYPEILKDYVICKGDESQAEARIVAWAGNMRKTIELFLDPKRDIHIETAALISAIAIALVTAEQRYSAKRIRYGVNYDMHPPKFAKTYNKDAADIGMPFITAKRAKELIDRFHEIEPDLKGTYHRIIQEQLRKNLQLYNFFGRKMQFHQRISDDLFRMGYSWYAQSTVADLINEIWKRIDDKIWVIHQNHDELVWLSRKDKVEEDCKIVWEASRIELDICPDKTVPKLIIPMDITYGTDWYNNKTVPEFLKAA